MNLDYGVRSKCCFAPIRFAFKLNKKTGIKNRIFICCTCQTRDVDIVDRDDPKKIERGKFAED